MIIIYADAKMQKDFEDRRRLRKSYSSYLLGLENRFSELRAVSNLGEITHEPPPRRHKLNGNWDGCWGICVNKNYRLVVQPMGIFDENDLATITEVKIEALIDYH